MVSKVLRGSRNFILLKTPTPSWEKFLRCAIRQTSPELFMSCAHLPACGVFLVAGLVVAVDVDVEMPWLRVHVLLLLLPAGAASVVVVASSVASCCCCCSGFGFCSSEGP